MSTLAVMSLVFSVFLVGVYGFMVWRPEQFRAWYKYFPRSVWPARVLVAVDLVWVVTVMHHADFGGFNWIKDIPIRLLPALGGVSLGPLDFLKDFVVWGGIVSFFLIIRYMKELLAPRALGGLLLLLANPILNAARWLDTPWRFVMVIVAYILVIKGMLLVLSPFRLRQLGDRFLGSDRQCRVLGSVGLVLAVVIGGLGLLVY